MKVTTPQILTAAAFLDPAHRNPAGASLSRGKIACIEMPVQKGEAARIAPQLQSFLLDPAFQQRLAGLVQQNSVIGKLQLDVSLMPKLTADGLSVGVDLAPLFESLKVEKEVKQGANLRPKTVVEGAVLGGTAGVILTSLSSVSRHSTLVTLCCMLAGAVIWPHAQSLEFGLNEEFRPYGKIGL